MYLLVSPLVISRSSCHLMLLFSSHASLVFFGAGLRPAPILMSKILCVCVPVWVFFCHLARRLSSDAPLLISCASRFVNPCSGPPRASAVGGRLACGQPPSHVAKRDFHIARHRQRHVPGGGVESPAPGCEALATSPWASCTSRDIAGDMLCGALATSPSAVFMSRDIARRGGGDIAKRP